MCSTTCSRCRWRPSASRCTFNAFTASVCNLNQLPRASDHLGRPGGRPSILANYLSTEEDRQVAADSLRLTRRIAAMPALAPYRPREVKPGVQYQSDEDLARLAGDIGTTIFHPVGTCKMGRRTTRWRWWTAACACAACGACGWLTPA
jgi:choline dehydrogenase